MAILYTFADDTISQADARNRVGDTGVLVRYDSESRRHLIEAWDAEQSIAFPVDDVALQKNGSLIADKIGVRFPALADQAKALLS